MNSCLNVDQLLNLWAAGTGESADASSHLAQCKRCAAAYDELNREAAMITSALNTAADRQRWRPTAAAVMRSKELLAGYGIRTTAIFGGAIAFGGAAAIMFLVALGWHPANSSKGSMNPAANALVARSTVDGRTRLTSVTAASGTAPSATATDASSAIDAIDDDPIAGFAYGDSLQPAYFTNSPDDLFFCVPDDDSAFCS
jgi:hypothetical protein